MSISAISLLEAATGNAVPSAPEGGVLATSSDAHWRGIIVEHHRLNAMEMIPHTLVGHRLVINIGEPGSVRVEKRRTLEPNDLRNGKLCHAKPQRFSCSALAPAF
jgi:hypothetical protein